MTNKLLKMNYLVIPKNLTFWKIKFWKKKLNKTNKTKTFSKFLSKKRNQSSIFACWHEKSACHSLVSLHSNGYCLVGTWCHGRWLVKQKTVLTSHTLISFHCPWTQVEGHTTFTLHLTLYLSLCPSLSISLSLWISLSLSLPTAVNNIYTCANICAIYRQSIYRLLSSGQSNWWPEAWLITCLHRPLDY